MTVYGDILFAENFIIGCALIYITAEVFGADLHGRTAKLRLAAGGVMCGLFAMLIFLPVRMPLTVVLEAGFAFAVSVVVFGVKGAWKKALVADTGDIFHGRRHDGAAARDRKHRHVCSDRHLHGRY